MNNDFKVGDLVSFEYEDIITNSKKRSYCIIKDIETLGRKVPRIWGTWKDTIKQAIEAANNDNMAFRRHASFADIKKEEISTIDLLMCQMGYQEKHSEEE